MNQRLEAIDGGRIGYLVMCDCGWRDISYGDRVAAQLLAQRHAIWTHGGDNRRAANRVVTAKRRSRRKK